LPLADGQKHDLVDTSVELLRALLQRGRDLIYVVGNIVHRLAVGYCIAVSQVIEISGTE